MSPLSERLGDHPLHLVLMGVSGTGKTTIAEALVSVLGWPFAEGDSFHPPANIAKMSSGHPLVDEDRWPWLQHLSEWTMAQEELGQDTILTCSALKFSYREVLRGGGPGTYFVHLEGDKGLLLERMGSREHFMPPELLESQLDTLEPLRADERGMRVDIANPPARIARMVMAQLDL